MILVSNQISFVIPKLWVMGFVMNSIMDLYVTLTKETAVCQTAKKKLLDVVVVIVNLVP